MNYEEWTFYLDTNEGRREDRISQPPGAIPMRCQLFRLYNDTYFVMEVVVEKKAVYLRKL